MGIMRNISREKLYLINTDKNQIRSSQRRIQQPCHIYLMQKLTASNYYHKELHLRCLTGLRIQLCFFSFQKIDISCFFFQKGLLTRSVSIEMF